MTRDDDCRHDDNSGDIIRFLAAGFGMGLLVGAALGVLLAPKSGRETRDQLRELATEFGTRAKTAASTIGEHATTTYGTVTERTRATAGEVGERVRKMGETVTGTAATVREVTGKVAKAAKKGYQTTMDELSASDEGCEEETG